MKNIVNQFNNSQASSTALAPRYNKNKNRDTNLKSPSAFNTNFNTNPFNTSLGIMAFDTTDTAFCNSCNKLSIPCPAVAYVVRPMYKCNTCLKLIGN